MVTKIQKKTHISRRATISYHEVIALVWRINIIYFSISFVLKYLYNKIYYIIIYANNI